MTTRCNCILSCRWVWRLRNCQCSTGSSGAARAPLSSLLRGEGKGGGTGAVGVREERQGLTCGIHILGPHQRTINLSRNQHLMRDMKIWILVVSISKFRDPMHEFVDRNDTLCQVRWSVVHLTLLLLLYISWFSDPKESTNHSFNSEQN